MGDFLWELSFINRGNVSGESKVDYSWERGGYGEF